jgi:GT2 family glycosyltransferase
MSSIDPNNKIGYANAFSKSSNCPSLSVIVPTRGRLVSIAELLRSLYYAKMQYGKKVEILLVDDTDPSMVDAVASMCARYEAKLIPGPHKVAAKRNIGAKEASGDILLFTDSDCSVSEEWLWKHACCHNENPKIGAVAGLVKLTGERSATGKAIEAQDSFTAAFQFAAWPTRITWACTANLSIRSNRFREIGGFDESLSGVLYGEDVDFGMRLTETGFSIARCPGAVVYHPRTTVNSFPLSWKKAFHCGRAEAELITRHPESASICLPDPLVIAATWLASSLLLEVSGWVWPLYWLVLSSIGMVLAGSPWEKGLNTYESIRSGLTGYLLRRAFIFGKLFGITFWSRPNLLLKSFIYHPGQVFASRDRLIKESASMIISSLFLLAIHFYRIS